MKGGCITTGIANLKNKENRNKAIRNKRENIKKHNSKVMPIIKEFRSEGYTYKMIASLLNDRGFRTFRKSSYNEATVCKLWYKWEKE